MRWRRIFGVLLAVAVVVCLALFIVKRVADSRFHTGYEPGQPVEYVPRDTTLLSYRQESFYFESQEGVQVPTVAAYPTESDGPFPCVIMLYGINQKKEIVNDFGPLFTDRGYALVIPDQHLRGERKIEGMNDIAEAFGLRKRVKLTVLEARRLLDTIAPMPDIDENRVYLWGLSFGAICSAPALAFEPRFKAGVFTVGGGELSRTFSESPSMKDAGAMAKAALTLAGSLMRPAEPTWYIAAAAPRPVLFQNALQDEIIPRSSAEALHTAAAEPKEIIWYDCTHEGNGGDLIPQMVTDGIDWIEANAL